MPAPQQGRPDQRIVAAMPPTTPSHGELPQLVTLAQASSALGITVHTLRKYISDGRLPGYRIGERMVRVDAADLARLARPIPAA